MIICIQNLRELLLKMSHFVLFIWYFSYNGGGGEVVRKAIISGVIVHTYSYDGLVCLFTDGVR